MLIYPYPSFIEIRSYLCALLCGDGDDHDADGVLAHVVEDAAVAEAVEDERVGREDEVEEGEGHAAAPGAGVGPQVGDASGEEAIRLRPGCANPALGSYMQHIPLLLFLGRVSYVLGISKAKGKAWLNGGPQVA